MGKSASLQASVNLTRIWPHVSFSKTRVWRPSHCTCQYTSCYANFRVAYELREHNTQ